jgi:hypothetical protein
MIRRQYKIGFVVLALMLMGAAYVPTFAYRFQQSFHNLESSRSTLNPVERVVLSLLLAS